MADNTPYMEVEATGVYEGILYEDMIETVKKNHKLYCDVIITRFFKEGFKRPLTFVPLWAMSLPLKKGDKVLVKFADDDWSRPYLWREKPEIDHWFWDKWKFPEKFENFTKQPEADENFSVQRIGDESFILYCKSYTLFRRNDAFFLIDKDNQVYLQCDKLQAEIKGDALVDIKGDCKGYIKKDFEGKIDGKATVTVQGDISITGKSKLDETISSDVNRNVGGNRTVSVSGSSTLTAGSVGINGGSVSITGYTTINGSHLIVT
jgi:hypothetical protein